LLPSDVLRKRLHLEPPSLILNARPCGVNSFLREIGSTFFGYRAHGGTSYASTMLGQLQNRRGQPNLRTRLTAALVVLGLIVLTAPLVVLPLAHLLARIL